MSNTKKVSIIVPIYGVEKYLRKALDSIINQTLKDIQIILVDDGGKDGCPQIIDEYASKDSRINVIHKKNGGYGSACNAGLNMAVGEYIAIFEPDDFVELNMYEKLYDIATKNDADIVKSEFYVFHDFLDKKGRDTKTNWYKWKNNLYKKPSGIFSIEQHPEFFFFHPSIWSCIYKRSFIESNNIRVEEIPGAGWTDNLFQIQTMIYAKRICFTEDAFYHWRLRQIDDALDLKDLTIPFLRTKTIHKWLKEQHVNNPNVWACLYKREISYLHIVARAGNVAKIRKILPLIHDMIKDMDKVIFQNSKYITKYEKIFLKRAENFIRFYYIYKLKRFFQKIYWYRHSIISIRWPSIISPREKEKYLILFGVMFYRNISDDKIRTFIKIKI